MTSKITYSSIFYLKIFNSLKNNRYFALIDELQWAKSEKIRKYEYEYMKINS